MIKFQFWEFGSKVKLRHAVALRFGLKEGKRALNITKFGMHSYLPNGHLNLWSYFNSKKLVKRETLSCAFAKVALKGGEIARNVAKVSVDACLLKWVPKSTFKFHFWKRRQKCILPWFDHPWLRAKIAPNIIKICVHAYLSNGYLNRLSKLNSKRESTKVHIFNLGWTNIEWGPK